MKELKDSLPSVVKTGRITIGYKETKNALLNGNLKLIILSKNCPQEIKEDMIYYSRISNTPVQIIDERSNDLGSICGKPFSISTLGIIDAGDSDILDILGKNKKG